MEFVSQLAAAIFILAIVGYILYNLFGIVRAVVGYFFNDQVNRYLLISRLHTKYLRVIEANMTYYANLSASDQKIFRSRTQWFIRMKAFIPRGGIDVVTPEMKALIAASAIQITFGLPGIYFKHFFKILIYPDNYYSTITQKFHQGEVNTRGFIVLSWVNFLKGYMDDTDGRNLGLHEMAHALKLEDAIRNDEYDFLEREVLNQFTFAGREEMALISRGEPSIFREYAATNDYEFFAVAVETFFEKPILFKKEKPLLFDLLAKLLKQKIVLQGDKLTVVTLD
jgi:hypothetical protein